MLITDLMTNEKDVNIIAEKFKLFIAKMFSSFIFNKQYSKIVGLNNDLLNKGSFLTVLKAVEKSNEIMCQLSIHDIRVCIMNLDGEVCPIIIFELKTMNAANFIMNQMDDFENYIKNNVPKFSDKQIQTLLDRFDGKLFLSINELANFMELLLETISKKRYKVMCPNQTSLDKLNDMLTTKIYDIEMCDK